MLFFKDEVRLGHDACPQLVLALVLVNQVYETYGIDDCWITSIDDGRHKNKSKHHTGEGFDLRSQNVPPDKLDEVNRVLRNKLGPLGFDVLLEYRGKPNEHFHIEWDPKYEKRVVRT